LSRLIRDPAEIEDVTQEAFIKAYRALPNFRGEAQGRSPRTVSEFQGGEDGESFEAMDVVEDNNTPESAMLTRQVAETVNRAIEALPEDLRTAITLREIEGLTYEEIAQAMSCPIGTVRSRIFRAREAISEQLKPVLGTSENKRW